MTPTITRDELLAKIKTGEKLAIVEALPSMYYEKEHLPGAINIPHDQVDELAPSLLPDKSPQIVVYCANAPCQNSDIATNRLIKLGYTNVKDYGEGKQAWIEAGLPTESARSKEPVV